MVGPVLRPAGRPPKPSFGLSGAVRQSFVELTGEGWSGQTTQGQWGFAVAPIGKILEDFDHPPHVALVFRQPVAFQPRLAVVDLVEDGRRRYCAPPPATKSGACDRHPDGNG